MASEPGDGPDGMSNEDFRRMLATPRPGRGDAGAKKHRPKPQKPMTGQRGPAQAGRGDALVPGYRCSRLWGPGPGFWLTGAAALTGRLRDA